MKLSIDLLNNLIDITSNSAIACFPYIGKNKKILAICDNLNTDIKGANLLNYDSLLISNGIHRDEIKNRGIKDVSKEYEAVVNFIQSDLKW